MAAQRSVKASKAAHNSAEHQKRPPKKVKPELSLAAKLQKRWRSIKDQISSGYLDNALRTAKKSR